MDKTKFDNVYLMRQSGATLQEIATHFGTSRERVRQWLVKHYGSTKIHPYLTTVDLARKANCDLTYIYRLRRQGAISAVKVSGKKKLLWDPEVAYIVTQYVRSRLCRVCKRPLPRDRWAYCSEECYTQFFAEAQKHSYLRMSEPQKITHNQRVARWVKAHPQQARRIRVRGQQKYYAKKSARRYHSQEYLIFRRCSVPVGTVVKVLGWGATRAKLRVEWGEMIVEVPFCCIKRLQKKKE